MGSLIQIKASAGSGKTYTLTRIFLELIRCSTWKQQPSTPVPLHPEASYAWQEILAITFTNKAAEEMRSRVLEGLKVLALKKEDSAEKTSLWSRENARQFVEELLHDYGSLNMRTIDSLLTQAARLSSLDLGISPEFEPCFVLDDVTGPIFDNIAEKARAGDISMAALFNEASSQMVNDFRELGFIAGKSFRDRTLKMVSFLLQVSPECFFGNCGTDDRIFQLPSPDGVPGMSTVRQPSGIMTLTDTETASRYCRAYHEKLIQTAKRLKDLLQDVEVSRGTLNKHLDSCIDSSDIYSLPSKNKLGSLAKDSLDSCLKASSRGKADPEAYVLYKRLGSMLREAFLLKSSGRMLPFVEIGRVICLQLREHMRNQAIVPTMLIPHMLGTFLNGAEKETNTAALLCRMGSPMTHILIDEFQDTSRQQWCVLLPLIQEALSQGGSLTIVGDVKQSIYGWRGGDSKLFDDVAKGTDFTSVDCQCCADAEPNIDEIIKEGTLVNGLLGKQKRTLESLPANWRSRQSIIDWNNAFFKTLEDKQEAKNLLTYCLSGFRQVSERNQERAKALIDDQARRLSLAFSGVRQKPSERTKEGGLVVIKRLPPECKDDDELLQENLKALVVELKQRYPLKDICILARSNEQCAEAASWLLEVEGISVVTENSLVIARQPIIEEIISLMRLVDSPDDEPSFWAAISGSLFRFLSGNDEWESWASQSHHALGLAQYFKQSYPTLWEDYFVPLLYATGMSSPYDIALRAMNLWKAFGEPFKEQRGFLQRFLEIIHRAEEAGVTDLPSFLEFWDSKGKEERVPLPEGMDAVQIMTIHKAKGLEREVVILPWLDFSPSGSSHEYRLQTFNDDGSPDSVLVEGFEKMGMAAQISSDMGDDWDEMQLGCYREALHLLYVAMTRVKTELYAFAKKPMPDSSGDNSGRKAFLVLLDKLLHALPCNYDGKAKLVLTEDEIRLGEAPDGDTHHADITLPSSRGDDESVSLSMPGLSVLSSKLEEIGGWSAAKRGTLIHHCLEFLKISGKGARPDARLAAELGMNTFPLTVPDKDKVLDEITDILTWYAEQPDTDHWLSCGSPEQGILDEHKELRRMDLLVDDGAALTVVEYKTGVMGTIPRQEHCEQLQGYLSLLSMAEGRPARGVLVYLDRKKIFPVSMEADR